MFKKCPFCERNIMHVELKNIPIHVNMQPAYNWVSYVCPNLDCNSILWVAIDPIAIKSDIIDWVIDRLRS